MRTFGIGCGLADGGGALEAERTFTGALAAHEGRFQLEADSASEVQLSQVSYVCFDYIYHYKIVISQAGIQI